MVIVTSLEEQTVGVWLVGSSGSLLANGANGLILRVTCSCTNWVAQMWALEVALMEVITFCGYKDAGVRLLLTVGCNTLVSGKFVIEAGGTLDSNVAPTLGAMVLGGRVGLMMACKSWNAILRLAALMAVVGMVFRSVRSTLHGPRNVRSAAEIAEHILTH
jgi:hypothetical protein